MANNNSRSGLQTAANLARAGKALSRIIKAAASGGIKGAAFAAAKEYAPELVKIAVAILIVLIVTPVVVIASLPNIFFGFNTAKLASVEQMTRQAQTVGAEYFNLEQFERTEIDSVITSIASSYSETGQQVNDIVIVNSFTDDDLLWFISILSVLNNQNLSAMNAGEMREMSASRISYSAYYYKGTLTIIISKIEQESWMTRLGFNAQEKNWARTLHKTLAESNALEKYADSFAGAGTSYAGDSFSGSYIYGNSHSNSIDISGFTDPGTKNAHDLAAYAIQAWENNWGYVWGTFGTVLNESLYNYKVKQYPDGVGNYADFIREHWLNRRTADCIGLIKGYGWLDTSDLTIRYGTNGMPDYGANQMRAAAIASGAEHGTMNTLPEIPGICLWKNGHAGVYIGGGYAIEAMGTKYGVVKTAVSERGWEEWYMLPYISYGSIGEGG